MTINKLSRLNIWPLMFFNQFLSWATIHFINKRKESYECSLAVQAVAVSRKCFVRWSDVYEKCCNKTSIKKL